MSREYISSANGYVFTADCPKNDQGTSRLILRLDQSDSDTLQVWYRREETKCFILYNYTDFQHNGRSIVKSSQTSALLVRKTN